MNPAALLGRLDAVDRIVLRACTGRPRGGRIGGVAWRGVTHAGGAVATILSVLVPLALAPWPRDLTARVAAMLIVSHLVVQGLKRGIGRSRPDVTAIITAPDRFSFPSGHACAALAVAWGYAQAWPDLAPLLIPFAVVVGWSRVVLGVHYPGDVLAGQLIAAGTAMVI